MRQLASSTASDAALVFDIRPNPALTARLGVPYVDLEQLFRESDIISLHVPLTPATHHLVDPEALALIRPVVASLKTGRDPGPVQLQSPWPVPVVRWSADGGWWS